MQYIIRITIASLDWGNAVVALSVHSIMDGPMSYPYLKSQYTKKYFVLLFFKIHIVNNSFV